MKLNPRLKWWLTQLAKLLITGLAVWFVVKKIDFAEIFSHLQQANWWLLLPALIFFALSKAVSSVRLNVFFKAINIRLTELNNLKLYLLGMFYNLFLPGGIGGDGYKIYLLNKKTGIKAKKITIAVLLDRVNGMLGIALLTLALLAFMSPFPQWVRVAGPICIIVGYAAYYFLVKLLFKDYSRSTFLTTVYSLFVQILQCICVLFIIKAFGITGNYADLLFIFMLSSIVAVLPFTIGGIGSREVVFIWGSQWLGIDPNSAVTISLFFYLITAFTSFWGIYYSFKNPEIPSSTELAEEIEEEEKRKE